MDLFRALLGLPPGASSVADGIDRLHFFVISVTMLVSTFVFGAVLWFCVRYRRRSRGQLTKRSGGSKAFEALTIAAVLGTFVLWWVLGYRQYLALAEPPPDAEVVYVEAKQWTWKFAYAGGHETNDVLTVPVGRPVKLVMTSRDVIHSFYVPAFRIKMDVLPGRTTVAWFRVDAAGSYPIWCAEYCGVSHSLMRGEVTALDPAAYAEWHRRGASEGGLAARGKEVAIRRACVACHTFDGQRHVGPTWSHLFGSERILDDGRRVVADEAYLTRSMMEPNADRVAGYPTVMPTYQGTLSAAEAGALVELIRSLADGPVTPGAALPPLDVRPAVDGGPPP